MAVEAVSAAAAYLELTERPDVMHEESFKFGRADRGRAGAERLRERTCTRMIMITQRDSDHTG